MATLKDYTVELLKSGKSDEEILQTLMRFVERDKALALLAYAKEVFAEEQKPKEKPLSPPEKSLIQIRHSVFLFGLLVLFFVFSSLLIALIVSHHTPKVMNDNTFFELANACEPAYYEKVFDTATVGFTSYANCTLEKKILAVADTESVFAQELFTNTSLHCQYIKSHLDPAWIMKLSGGLLDENCKGTFKEAYITLFTMEQIITFS